MNIIDIYMYAVIKEVTKLLELFHLTISLIGFNRDRLMIIMINYIPLHPLLLSSKIFPLNIQRAYRGTSHNIALRDRIIRVVSTLMAN